MSSLRRNRDRGDGPDQPDRLCRIAAEAASSGFGVSARDLRAASRGRAQVAFARQVAMYLGHTVFGLSLTAVGRAFRRDRTTAAYACRLVEERREDAALDALLGLLEGCCKAARVRVRSSADREARA